MGPEDFLQIEKEQKAQFEKTVEGILLGKQIALVGEEIEHEGDTIASRIAGRHQRSYVNLEMPVEQRKQANVPPGYADEAAHYPPEEVVRCHAIREQFMFEQVKRNGGNAKNVLVICGLGHLEGLAKLFREAGDEVEVIDLRSTDWFRSDWGAEYLQR